MAKARAKVFRNKHTGKSHGVTPAKTRAYEHSVSMQALKHRPAKLLEGPLLLGVKVVRSIPKGFSKKKKDAAIMEEIRPVTKPDLSNYMKSVEDALNGIIWQDDNQIVGYLEGTGKYYGMEPRIEITVKEIGVTIWKADPNTETGLGSGRSVSDDFIAVVDGYWFRDCISDWKERRGMVYNQNAGVIGAEDARKEEKYGNTAEYE